MVQYHSHTSVERDQTRPGYFSRGEATTIAAHGSHGPPFEMKGILGQSAVLNPLVLTVPNVHGYLCYLWGHMWRCTSGSRPSIASTGREADKAVVHCRGHERIGAQAAGQLASWVYKPLAFPSVPHNLRF